MKRNKSGISLIVLVITIIVMIILAGSVIISLSNAGIIGKAQEAVDANNVKQVQSLAALAWSEAYIDKMEDETVDLEERVIDALDENKVDRSKYVIDITENGVSVKAKTTLGALVASAADYGKTIDYTVTVGEGSAAKTHSDWKVLYEDEANGYVYIISSKSVENTTLDEGVTVASLTTAEKALYEKFRVGSWPKYTLVDEHPDYGDTMYNCQAVAQLIKRYSGYANTTTYGAENVIGAIGGPTIELLAASWNAQKKTPTMTLTTDTYGYNINGDTYLEVTSDEFLVLSDEWYCLASPSATNYDNVMYAGYGYVIDDFYYGEGGVRPVVCLSSNIPAYEGDTTAFALVK